MKLRDKTAIVTGSSRGIGRETALLFAQEGARIVVNCRTNKAKGNKVVKEIKKNGGEAVLVQADVTSEQDVKRLIEEAIKQFKRVDILVNNAGEIFRPGDWESMDRKTWQQTIDVNLTSCWLTIKQVAPLMKKQGKGSIVNVTSVYGFLGSTPVLAYTAAKGGLITLTKAFAKELAPETRVNAVAPSNVWTDMTKGAGDELVEFFRQQTPLKQIAEPEEVAKSILFLASDDASYITGEMLVVDGGYSLK